MRVLFNDEHAAVQMIALVPLAFAASRSENEVRYETNTSLGSSKSKFDGKKVNNFASFTA